MPPGMGVHLAQRGAPNHMVSSSGPLTLMKLAWHSLAMALASSVLPQPALKQRPQAKATKHPASSLQLRAQECAKAAVNQVKTSRACSSKEQGCRQEHVSRNM